MGFIYWSFALEQSCTPMHCCYCSYVKNYAGQTKRERKNRFGSPFITVAFFVVMQCSDLDLEVRKPILKKCFKSYFRDDRSTHTLLW